jgi:hypothetical protein
LAELNSRYSNVRATGVPVQCWPELCDEISRTMTFVPKMSLEEMADNRYVMDVDGNAYVPRSVKAPPATATHTSPNTGTRRASELIFSRIKSRSRVPSSQNSTTVAFSPGFTMYVSVAYPRPMQISPAHRGVLFLQVPVRVDYSDLYNLLAFFDGGVDEARTGNHDDLAEEIATAGADWASKNWRSEDMQACKIRLVLSFPRDTPLMFHFPYRCLPSFARVGSGARPGARSVTELAYTCRCRSPCIIRLLRNRFSVLIPPTSVLDVSL